MFSDKPLTEAECCRILWEQMPEDRMPAPIHPQNYRAYRAECSGRGTRAGWLNADSLTRLRVRCFRDEAEEGPHGRNV